MASENWKEVLKSQHADLERLEAMDAAISDATIADDIDKILNRNSAKSYALNEVGGTAPPVPPTYDNDNIQQETFANDSSRAGDSRGAQQSIPKSPTNELAGVAPETAERLTKAKLRVLTKQVQEELEARKKVEEHARDLQRQLKQERDENKSLRGRISTMESELKRNSKRNSDVAAAEGSTEALAQEVFVLKKDLEAAQRIVKQGETASKTKDGQIKRAAETIARLKQQLKDAQSQHEQSTSGDKARLIHAEERIKVLEKQRADLIDGFRKQLKLIDILKRQKVHIEAARLLAFTEDEFMKTLDWKI